jgi:hypothetical protein
LNNLRAGLFQLLAQLLDVGVNSSFFTEVFIAPDKFQELFREKTCFGFWAMV